MKKLIFTCLLVFFASCNSYTPTADLGDNDAFVRAFVNSSQGSSALITVNKIYELTVDTSAIHKGDSFFVKNARVLASGAQKDMLLSLNNSEWRLIWSEE